MLIKYNLWRHRAQLSKRCTKKKPHSRHLSIYLLSSLTASLDPLNPDFSPSYNTLSYDFNLTLAMGYDQLLWLSQQVVIN